MRILPIYGDGVSDVDIGKLAKFHKLHDKILTVNKETTVFGEMVCDDHGREFNEKPQATAGVISGDIS